MWILFILVVQHEESVCNVIFQQEYQGHRSLAIPAIVAEVDNHPGTWVSKFIKKEKPSKFQNAKIEKNIFSKKSPAPRWSNFSSFCKTYH